MKKAHHYINTMYPAAYRTLVLGLTLFAISIIAYALKLHSDLLAGDSDIIYRYPKILADILHPMAVLVPITILVDINERKKKS